MIKEMISALAIVGMLGTGVLAAANSTNNSAAGNGGNAVMSAVQAQEQNQNKVYVNDQTIGQYQYMNGEQAKNQNGDCTCDQTQTQQQNRDCTCDQTQTRAQDCQQTCDSSGDQTLLKSQVQTQAGRNR